MQIKKILNDKYNELLNKELSLIFKKNLRGMVDFFISSILLGSFIIFCSFLIFYAIDFLFEYDSSSIFIGIFLLYIFFMTIMAIMSIYEEFLILYYKISSNTKNKIELIEKIRLCSNENFKINYDDVIQEIFPINHIKNENKIKLSELILKSLLKTDGSYDNFLKYLDNCYLNEIPVSNNAIELEYYKSIEMPQLKEKIKDKIDDFKKIQINYGEYFNDIKNENLTYKIISRTLNKLNSNSIEELDNLEKMLVFYIDDYSNDEINFIKEYKHFKKMTTIFENKMSSSEKEEYQKIKHYILESESKMIMKDSIKYMRDFSYKLNENYN